MKVVERAYEEAKEVIRKCSHKAGLFASSGKIAYDAIWARDSIISFLGASLIPEFKEVFKKNLETLAINQGKKGQIPNCVDKFSRRKPHVDFQTIDSSLWFIIGCYLYKERYKDKKFFIKIKKNINSALNWLSYQDIGENCLLGQLPTTDWQDAFPHKYGYTINTHALYYKILNLIGEKKKAEKIKFLINEDKEHKLWEKDFYLAYRWKNHGKYKEIGNWFDSLGNLLAIVFGLASEKQGKKIISYIKKNKIDLPYPIKSIWPPIKKSSIYWQDYFNDCDAREPYQYLNAGVWTYIGGFYILSLIKLREIEEAKKQLTKLAEANLKGNFPEWLHGKTGKPSKGKNQAWNAGMYILAYESLKKKKLLI